MSKDKLRILVIDDEVAVRETLCENLSECGFEVSSASDGEDAVRQIEKGNLPDIVITDIIMPKKEGLEVIVEIRKKYPKIKVIAISGGGRTKTVDFLTLAEKLGADAVLAKPLDLDELENTVRKIAL